MDEALVSFIGDKVWGQTEIKETVSIILNIDIEVKIREVLETKDRWPNSLAKKKVGLAWSMI